MNLAKQIADSMASGSVSRLPRLTRHASPAFARKLLDAYYRLSDEVRAARAEEGPTLSMEERVAHGVVLLEIERALSDTHEWLSNVARRGGRGTSIAAALPVVGARP